MKLQMAATPSELRQRLLRLATPLEIFHLVNLCPFEDWTFHFWFEQEGQLNIGIDVVGETYGSKLVRGIVPSVFCAQVVQFRDGDFWYEFSTRDVFHPGATNEIECVEVCEECRDFVLILRGFGDNVLSPSFRDEEVSDFLKRESWLGGVFVPAGSREVRCKILDTGFVVLSGPRSIEKLKPLASSDGISTEQTLTVRNEDGPIGEVYVAAANGCKDTTFAWHKGGELAYDDLESIAHHRISLRPGYYEFRCEDLMYAPDGRLGISEKSKEYLDRSIVRIMQWYSSEPYQEYEQNVQDLALRKQVEALDVRKSNLMDAKYVHFDGVQVFCEPTNEMEVVSLHHKLEGMTALPFILFESLEYTAKVGIDAIAKVKVSNRDPLQIATVEYEYKLSNFFKHKHPTDQVDYIVCWEIDENARSQCDLIDSRCHWYRYMRLGARSIIVCEISNYPGVTVKRPRS